VGVFNKLKMACLIKRREHLIVTHYCADDKIEKNEMSGTCSSDGGGERRVQGFGGKT
jgi:hypothetical protein